jgi:hypothetical protein
MLVHGWSTVRAVFEPTVGSAADAAMPLPRSLAAFSIVSGSSPASSRLSY